jgi:hypothetical protein
MRLHGLLLERERRAYEASNGSTTSPELFRLVLHDDRFVWLRSLSRMIARVDAVVDAGEPLAAEQAERALDDVYRLLKSGEAGEFQRKYHAALQESPDVVMAHADVSKLLRRDR